MASEGDIQHSLHQALQANKDHQYALRIYSERIDAELESLNKLLAAADVSDTEEDILEVNSGGWVTIPNAVDAVAPLLSSELLDQNSPFRDVALRRQRFVEATVVHPWKTQELEALADAVRSENHRLYAVEAQLRGQEGLLQPSEDTAKFMSENMTGLDWDRVSAKVSKSSLSGDHRSAKECEVKWLGERHPQFNHSQWTQHEIDQVKALVANCVPGQIDWVNVAEKLGTHRTPVDCMRHAIIRRAHTWESASDQRLRDAVEMYGIDNWHLEDATPQQCQTRYTRYLDPTIKHGPFTEEENKLLRDGVAVYGNAWQDIAQFIPGRTNEQCRERAQELSSAANPKRKWTDIEDRFLLESAEQAESIDWKEISKALGTGRTESQCRNRYGVLMRRIARTTIPGSTGTLRPILPAPARAPDPSQIAGSSASRAPSRPPNVPRPILPAPTLRPSEPSSVAGPSGTFQAYSRSPSIAAPPAEIPTVSSSQTGTVVSDTLTETAAHLDMSNAPLVVQEVQAASSQASTSMSPGETRAPPQPRPRPRPRRKQAEPESTPAPSTSSAPPAQNVQDGGMDPSAPVTIDKGKARETAPEPGGGETTARTRRPTKRLLDAAVDNPPSKKRQTRKKISATEDSAVPQAEAETTASAQAASTVNNSPLPPPSPNNSANGPRPLAPSQPAASTTATTITASAIAPQNPGRGGKRGRRSGPRTQPSKQQPTRRSTRKRQSSVDPVVDAAAPSVEANVPSSSIDANLTDNSSELSSLPPSP
ncbi:uncharacterized protein B0H18DRAFT_967262 [Fomitopsis serialis]|uniref:uncharacterized protein n=1 Tax=Fomitopsis serialis TaxID=139415 RepID=UPI002007E99A|nr:uncharacterized protein B0H18DRAFT_967262 [Neoantrodia serialis]KAH9938455.1 hypothetical protein B0H18DRAFT_967262 [Neoantrodia serialis]